MTIATGFEKCLITTWEEWDPVDAECIVFYDAVLNQELGNFSAGDKVESVTFDLGDNYMEVIGYDGTSEIRKLEVKWV